TSTDLASVLARDRKTIWLHSFPINSGLSNYDFYRKRRRYRATRLWEIAGIPHPRCGIRNKLKPVLLLCGSKLSAGLAAVVHCAFDLFAVLINFSGVVNLRAGNLEVDCHVIAFQGALDGSIAQSARISAGQLFSILFQHECGRA